MAAAFGPVAGGVLVQYGWRWVFAVNIPIGIAILITGWRVLPRTVTRNEPLPDVAGSGLLIVSIGTLTGALVQAPDWGWGSARILLLLAAAVLTGAAFVRRCVTHPAPVVEIPTLRDRTFGIANFGNLLFSIGFSILLLAATLWCQQVWRYSALRAGLALAPAPPMVAPTAILSLPLIRRFGLAPRSPHSAASCSLSPPCGSRRPPPSPRLRVLHAPNTAGMRDRVRFRRRDPHLSSRQCHARGPCRDLYRRRQRRPPGRREPRRCHPRNRPCPRQHPPPLPRRLVHRRRPHSRVGFRLPWPAITPRNPTRN